MSNENPKRNSSRRKRKPSTTALGNPVEEIQRLAELIPETPNVSIENEELKKEISMLKNRLYLSNLEIKRVEASLDSAVKKLKETEQKNQDLILSLAQVPRFIKWLYGIAH